jgi:predicted regulator of Ras-like GTPase activity (Roadblock/LC7/MglB family)
MVHSMLGNIYLKKKRYAEAVEQFQRVLSLNPDDMETQEKLQEALSAKQEPASVKKEPPRPEPKAESKPAPKAEEKKEERPQKDYIQKSLTAAELYSKKEEFSKAIEIYNELLTKDPDNLIIQQRLREVYGLQDKKMQKERERAKPAAPAGNTAKDKIDSDKITAQDILDVMKEAVEEDRVDEEPAKKAAPKKEEAKAEKKEHAAEPAKAIDPGKAGKIEAVLKELGDVDGIVGSFFLQHDGKIMASVIPDKMKKEEITPVVTSIVGKTQQSVQNMKQGKMNRVAITAESGVLTFTDVNGGILFIIGNEKINVGKMGYVLKDVIEHIKKAIV